MKRWVALILILLGVFAGSARAQFEAVGKVVTLPEKPGPHWFWLSDILLHRTALFDGDTGEQLGAISSGSGGVGFIIAPLFSPDHREIYLAETYYARGVRGARSDVVTVYDGQTLAPLAEVSIPPHRGEYFPGNAANALSDDGRFMAVLNVTPATSLSIVDVKARRFIAEVPIPGCSLVFAAGPRRFFSVCANGMALVLVLDEAGNQQSLERTEAFFDAQKDPVTEKAVRRGNEWLFVSFEGIVHPVDVSGARLTFGETWSLVTEEDRSARWRIGGPQHLAVHVGLKRLYALMHRGEPDTHKEAGSEVWVFDLDGKKRLQRVPVLNPLASFVSVTGALDRRRGGSFAKWIMSKTFPNPGVERILVTQDDHPILIASASIPPTITIHDAVNGNVIREISEPGPAGSLLFTP